jgi:hypothetical protein
MLPRKITVVHLFLGCLCAAAASAATAVDLTKIADGAVWRLHNRKAQLLEEGGRKFVRLEARSDHGIAWLLGSDFKEGTIEVQLRGKNDPGRSFVGIAFRGVDDTTYDAVYFRAFNFKNADPARRLRAVQYVSWPKFTWQKLRAEHPGKYEQPVSPVPDPDDWFRARIVIEGGKVSVFVNDSATPSLVVAELSERRGGMVGLWVDTGSLGDFANLTLTPKRKSQR